MICWNLKWTDKWQKVFDEFKIILTSDLSLMHFIPKLNIILVTDASDYCIGAVLLRKYDNENEKAVCVIIVITSWKEL